MMLIYDSYILTMIVPAVWKRNGFSSLLCTTKFGRIATGGTSTTIATFILDYYMGRETHTPCQVKLSGTYILGCF